MKPGTRTIQARLAVLLLGVALLPACAAARTGASTAFREHDANKDGYLSLDEFKAKGKDELAFKAADTNGDGRVDPGEFDKYLARKAADQAKPGSGESGQPKPAQPQSGY